MDAARSGLSTPHSALGTLHRRFVAGLALVTVVTTVAVAQPPAGGRAAVLLPPRPLGPREGLPVARASGGELPPPFPDRTPVTRPANKAAAIQSSPTRAAPRLVPGGQPTGPAWLSGVDPNVLPAGANLPGGVGGAGRPSTGSALPGQPIRSAPVPVRSEPSLVTKGLNRLKGMVTTEQPLPAPTETAGAAGPLRGTSASGAPVYAGPPAWHWYGWGSVTPGANTYAPAGQYPKASANWYSVTGATPGAFPVPVANPGRTPAGSEPPAYTAAPPARGPALPTIAPTIPVIADPPGAPTPGPVSGSKFESARPAAPAPALLPVPTPGPVAELPVPAPPASVGVPALVPLPVMPPVLPPLPAPPADPIAVVPLPGPVGPEPAPTAVPPEPAAPAALPASVTDDIGWKPTPERPAPPGTWVPAVAPGQPGAARTPAQPVARGQVSDADPSTDPVVTLIQSMCRGRATGVDIRRTGPKKVMVCFEAPSQVDASKLVKDISARPELAPLQIDFAVLVK